jgi:hypothetical protein
MPRPPRYAVYKSKKDRYRQIQEAWETSHAIMLDPNAPAGVRLEASEKRLDRLIGKAAQRIDAHIEHSIGRQAMQRYATTPEKREALRKLWGELLAASEEKPAIDVTPTSSTEDW